MGEQQSMAGAVYSAGGADGRLYLGKRLERAAVSCFRMRHARQLAEGYPEAAALHDRRVRRVVRL